MSSRNIKISEGDIARAFGPVSRLNVFDHGGGIEPFVLDDDVALVTKSVDENGTYTAAADGVYGYSRVTVNCDQERDSISGKGPDGNTYAVTKDEEGDLIITNVPVEIRITTLPNVLIYGDGARIGYDGIVVTAYRNDGEVWTSEAYPDGIVPFSELHFPLAYAHYDPDSGNVEYGMTSDDVSGVRQPVPAARVVTGYASSKHGSTAYECRCRAESASTMLILLDTSGYVPVLLIAGKTNSASAYLNSTRVGYSDRNDSGSASVEELNIINDKEVYTWVGQSGPLFSVAKYELSDTAIEGPEYSLPAAVGDYAKVAYVALYGKTTQVGGGVQIPVQWARPGDHEILETAFGIDVIPGPSGSDN